MRDLRELLVELRPSLVGESEGVLLAISRMLWAPAMGARMHARDSTFSYFPARELEAYFGRGGFSACNAKHGIFEVIEGSLIEGTGLTRGYRPIPDIDEAVSQHLRRVDEKPATLITLDGARVLTAPRALASKNTEGREPRACAGAPITKTCRLTLIAS